MTPLANFPSAPRPSVSGLQARANEACKQQSLGDLATARVSDIANHLTACVKATDDLAAALRAQGETEAKAKARTLAMNRPAPSGSVVVRLAGTARLPFKGNCSLSNRAGTNSKSYEDDLPLQITGENVAIVNCSFISKSDFRHDLKLEITKDGKVIGESDTDAPYSVVGVLRDLN